MSPEYVGGVCAGLFIAFLVFCSLLFGYWLCADSEEKCDGTCGHKHGRRQVGGDK